MKRGKPLERRTPLKAGKPLERKTPLKASRAALPAGKALARAAAPAKPRKALPARSAAARQVAGERQGIRLELLAQRGAACEGCPVTPVGNASNPRPWSDMHEVLTRARGGSPTDPGNILCLCRRCHEWVTTHETEARALGLVRGRTAAEHEAAFRVGQRDLTGGMIEP